MDEILTTYSKYPLIEGPLKVENIKVLQGANYFSGGPVVLIRLNLKEYDEVFTNQIEGFYQKLSLSLPSLIEHHCSEAKKGGFFFRVQQGTLLGHVIEHVAIELQTIAGMNVGYGKTRSTLQQGVYNIIFRFLDEKAGIYAGKAAVNLINAILLNKTFDVTEIIENLIDIRELNLLGPSTQAIVDEAEKRKIPFLRLDAYNLVQLGTGKYQKRIRATITSDTNLIAVETADNKYLTTLMLKDAGIPVLETIKTNNIKEIIEFSKKLNVPLVIKPTEGNLGKYLRTNLTKGEEIEAAFHYAMHFNNEVIAQPFVKGNIYRLLVIDFKFVAAAELTPPYIIGNGSDNIEQLIFNLNENPLRQKGDKSKLSKVEIDDITLDIIAQKGLQTNAILKKGEKLFLKNSGNMRLGAASKDVTNIINPFNIFLAERAAKVIDLNIAGIDIIADDISIPIENKKGYILEVNAAPDFRIHLMPTIGERKDVAQNMINMLFPPHLNTKIPIFSITGSYGKTTTANLLKYCLKQEGYKVGFATSDGLFIDDILLKKGNMTFSENAVLILKDNSIDCAVLETSFEGIMKDGLGYQFANYGIILNLNDKHKGEYDIKYIEDIAYAKSVVAEQVYDEGFAILNADNELILEMKERAYSTIVLFSEKENNPIINAHNFRGGMSIYIKQNNIVTNHRGVSKPLVALNEIPLINNNPEKSYLNCILAACAALYAHKVKEEHIATYLKTYQLIA